MGEKIKILNIVRDGNIKKEVPSHNGKKTFAPIEQPWYIDEDTASDFPTDELDKTLDNVKIENGHISIIRDANANFFASKNQRKELKTMIENVPSSINVLDNADTGKSALPREIIAMRQNEYKEVRKNEERILRKINLNVKLNEKDIIEQVLMKKNVDLNPTFPMPKLIQPRPDLVEPNFKPQGTTQPQDLGLDVATLPKFSIPTPNAVQSPVNSEQKVAPVQVPIVNTTVNEEVIAHKDTNKSALDAKGASFKPEMVDDASYDSAIDDDETALAEAPVGSHDNDTLDFKKDVVDLALTPEKVQDYTLDNSAELNERTAQLKPVTDTVETSSGFTQEIESMLGSQSDKKPSNKTEDIHKSIMSISNLDYTVSNMTNDFDKSVIDTTGTKINSNNLDFDATTVLVDNLFNGVNNLNNIKNNFKETDFDDFEKWMSSSREIKKLKKMAKKENQKLTKMKK